MMKNAKMKTMQKMNILEKSRSRWKDRKKGGGEGMGELMGKRDREGRRRWGTERDLEEE